MHLKEYLFKNKIKSSDFCRIATKAGRPISQGYLYQIMVGSRKPAYLLREYIERLTNGEVKSDKDWMQVKHQKLYDVAYVEELERKVGIRK